LLPTVHFISALQCSVLVHPDSVLWSLIAFLWFSGKESFADHSYTAFPLITVKPVFIFFFSLYIFSSAALIEVLFSLHFLVDSLIEGYL
jgi:hypothetical protein